MTILVKGMFLGVFSTITIIRIITLSYDNKAFAKEVMLVYLTNLFLYAYCILF